MLMGFRYLLVWLAILAELCCGETYNNCGAEGGRCGIECNERRIQNMQDYVYGSYVSSLNVHPTFPACVLNYLDYRGVTRDETVIDLSAKSLILNYLCDYLEGVSYNKINTLNFSSNIFYNYGYRSENYFSNNDNSLPTFINMFTNLTQLDLSNITKAGFVFFSTNLLILDFLLFAAFSIASENRLHRSFNSNCKKESADFFL